MQGLSAELKGADVVEEREAQPRLVNPRVRKELGDADRVPYVTLMDVQMDAGGTGRVEQLDREEEGDVAGQDGGVYGFAGKIAGGSDRGRAVCPVVLESNSSQHSFTIRNRQLSTTHYILYSCFM